MKKFYSILLMTALGASAAVAAPPVKSQNTFAHHTVDALFGVETGAVKSNRAKTFGQLSDASRQALRPAAEGEDFKLITEAPAGTLHTMTGSSISFYVDWGEVNMEDWCGLA